MKKLTVKQQSKINISKKATVGCARPPSLENLCIKLKDKFVISVLFQRSLNAYLLRLFETIALINFKNKNKTEVKNK